MLFKKQYKKQKRKVQNMKTNEEILKGIHETKIHSPATKRIYRYATNVYCKQQQSTLPELLLEADTEEEQGVRWKDRTLKKRLLNFRQYLITNYTKNTVHSYFNAIQSIYKYYEIEIGTLPSLNTKTLNIPEPINYTDLPTKDIIKKSLNIADILMKAIILFMSSSGCAKRETLNLTIQDFIDATKDYHKKNNIYEIIPILQDRDDVIPTFRLKRQKTNKYYYTFCSPEAVTAILNYLITVEIELKPTDNLFKIHSDYLTTSFMNLNKKLHLGKKGSYNRLRSHMLRKFHASQLYNSGLSLEEVDALQGRRKDSTHRAYFMEDPQKLREKYIEHLDCLTINLDVNNLDIKSEEFIELENENNVLKSEISSIKSDLDFLKEKFF